MQRRVWEGASIGGGVALDRIATGRATRFTEIRTVGAMVPTEVSGCVNSDTGSGRLGETVQQVRVAELALILLEVVSAMFSIIAAIFGQCGSHGWPGFAAPWFQQPAIATAGEAIRPNSKKRATSLERIFTANAGLIVYRPEPDICDLNHTRMLSRSHLVITCAQGHTDVPLLQ